ncbi:MAG: DNA pilot protein [Microviridae sp.]|nr:MAG: DNA pilot protein [Microviridae sp.]
MVAPLVMAAIVSAIAGAAGAAANADAQRKANNRNADMQKDFAENGIQRKVADAKAAGIHPLYALGASTPQFSPSYQAGDVGGPIAQSGQDISRALMATADSDTRRTSNATAGHMAQLQEEHMSLQNDLLRSQILRSNAQIGPPMPAVSYPVLPGNVDVITGDSVGPGTVKYTPHEITSGRSDYPFLNPGTVPGGAEYDFGPAGRWILPSNQASQALEDMDLGKYAITAAMNFGPKARLAELQRLESNKPDWVREIEKSENVYMRPFSDSRFGGKISWKALPIRPIN